MFLSLVQFMLRYYWKESYQRQSSIEKTFGRPKHFLQFLPVFPNEVCTYTYDYQLPIC